MMKKNTGYAVLAMGLMLTGYSSALAMDPLGSAFTYQGRLTQAGDAVNGAVDFEFSLWSEEVAGVMVAGPVGANLTVTDGLFTHENLDFGFDVFDGQERWLEIIVNENILSPRQRIAPAPYALFSTRPWETSGNDIFYGGSRVGIGTDSPSFRLDVRSPAPRAIFGWVTNESGTNYGVFGQTASTGGGAGVLGNATADTGPTSGVVGFSQSDTGRGVFGLATNSSGANYGVSGEARGPFGSGVFGLATSNSRSANASGVSGESAAVFGAGVIGRATHSTGLTYGVRGSADSPNGWAGYFTGRSYFSESVGIGVSLLEGPLASLHVVRSGVMLEADALGGEDLVIEDTDAKLGIFSTDEGSAGSGISLAQVDTTFGNLVDKWGLIRETTSGGDGLRFTFGTNASVFSNATVAYFDDSGNVGFGTRAPLATVHVQGSNNSVSEAALSSDDVVIEDSDAVLGLYSNSGGNWASAVVLGRLNGSGDLVDKWSMAQRTGGDLQFTYGTNPSYASNTKIMSLLPSGDVGIGIASPDVRLHAIGGTDAELDGGGYLQLGRSSLLNVVFDNNEIMARNNGATSTLYLNNEGGDVVIAPQGTARVRILEITGADLAEKFPMSDEPKPGIVVEIDPDRTGTLRIARGGAYNPRVAGVVSGANDLSVGVVLGNLPGHEDAPPIALSGRVWVHCDASTGAIVPGDLLTTSDTPGHAMKATDRTRAYGATIGKAMSSLKDGRGLVLVLVSLQ